MAGELVDVDNRASMNVIVDSANHAAWLLKPREMRCSGKLNVGGVGNGVAERDGVMGWKSVIVVSGEHQCWNVNLRDILNEVKPRDCLTARSVGVRVNACEHRRQPCHQLRVISGPHGAPKRGPR